MREYVTRAIILEKDPYKELDARITFWSRDLGKLRATAVSLSKITSKLSAHLEPGMVSDLRLVENRSLRVVDALKIRRLVLTPPEIRHLGYLLAEGSPDEALWERVVESEWSWQSVLKIMGWDPAHAQCVLCPGLPRGFSVSSQDFFCFDCASKLPEDALIYW